MSSKKTRIIHTLTFRLTLFYALLIAGVSFAGFCFMYLSLASHLNQRMDEQLETEILEFETLYKMDGIAVLRPVLISEGESEGITRTFYRLISPDMKVLASSDMSAWEEADLSSAIKEQILDDNGVFKTIPGPGSHHHKVRILSKKINDGNIIQVGESLQDNYEIMDTYRGIFGSGFVIMLICGSILGWFIAKRAVRGVERVTQTALDIGKTGFDHRVPLGNEGTEINNLAMAFNDMLKRIQDLIGELKEVTNNIAHDLRSPITRIRGIAETTLVGKQNIDEYQEMAGHVIEESDHLISMINTMLEIAKTEAGVETLSKKPVDIGKVAKDAYELFHVVAEDKGILLKFAAPPAPLIIHGDVTKLQRVIANILDNAIKYTPTNGKVSLVVEGSQTQVKVSIADTGTGINEKDFPHIFERFYRGDQSRSAPGNGLGLSLADAIVRAHGGTIEVESSPGKGSTFIVSLLRIPFSS